MLSSGHDTLLSVLHYRALDALATAADDARCATDVAPMRAAQHAVAAALAGPWRFRFGALRYLPSPPRVVPHGGDDEKRPSCAKRSATLGC